MGSYEDFVQLDDMRRVAEANGRKLGVFGASTTPQQLQFWRAFADADGDPDRLSEVWYVWRQGRIRKTLQRARKSGETWWTPDGAPTRLHLHLILHLAYTPSWKRTSRYLGQLLAAEEKRKRAESRRKKKTRTNAQEH